MIETLLDFSGSQYRHLALKACESTNSECLTRAAAGDPGNLWITAEQQTAGRGTRGREWDGGKGNLLASLLVRNPSSISSAAQLAFVSALGAFEAISRKERVRDLATLKWPNDLLINGKKCGGILLESLQHGKDLFVVVGVGINCKDFPANARFPATSLLAEGIEVGAERLFHTLAEEMDRMIRAWDSGNNFDGIRKQWLKHAHGLGGNVSVKIPEREIIKGKFSGLNKDGHIQIIQTHGGKVEVPAADVFFDFSD